MGRILAIDYGTKRTGLAVTDNLQIIATALETIPSHSLVSYLQQYIAKETVDAFVIGMPIKEDGSPSENAKYVQIAIKHLQKAFPQIPIHEADERYTSRMAHQALLASGVNKKQRREKATLDKISAVFILQWWMEYKKPI